MDDVPSENDVHENANNPNIDDDKNTSPSIGKELYNFIEQISSLQLTFRLTNSALLNENKRLDQTLETLRSERKSFARPESKKTRSEIIDFVYKQDAIQKFKDNDSSSENRTKNLSDDFNESL